MQWKIFKKITSITPSASAICFLVEKNFHSFVVSEKLSSIGGRKRESSSILSLNGLCQLHIIIFHRKNINRCHLHWVRTVLSKKIFTFSPPFVQHLHCVLQHYCFKIEIFDPPSYMTLYSLACIVIISIIYLVVFLQIIWFIELSVWANVSFYFYIFSIEHSLIQLILFPFLRKQ